MSSGSARHPSGLAVLCAVEFCERFASILLSSLLVLYLSERQHFVVGDAARSAGYLHALCYAAAIGGGALADRVGYRLTVGVGLSALAAGFSALATDSRGACLLAAPLLIIGNGLFKPAVTALLGSLYAPSDERKGCGFGWFYLTVNIAGMVAPVVGGVLRTRYGWAAAFGVAAMMALVGLLPLTMGSAVLRQEERPEVAGQWAVSTDKYSIRWAALGGVLLALGALGLALTQSTGVLLLWARDCTRRDLLGHVLPPDSFAALPSVIVLILTPGLSALWRTLRRYRREPSDVIKLAIGLLFMSLGYVVMVLADVWRNGSLASPVWLVGCKLSLTVGEMIALPSGLSLASTMAPANRGGLSMGLSFAAQALGFWIGGMVGGLWGTWSPALFFATLAGGTFVAAILVMASMAWLCNEGERRSSLR